MGFLDKLFGTRKDYPELDQASPAAQWLMGMHSALEKLTDQVSDPLEIVPTPKSAYIFIGNPPKKFGIAWIEKDGRITNFKTLVEEHGLSVISLEKLSARLRETYITHQEEARFSTIVNGRQVVVTPSARLLDDVEHVVEDAMDPKKRLESAGQ